MVRDGRTDLTRAAEALAARLPDALSPLARLAFNYWWSWAPGGADLFRSLDPDRWERCGQNPVRLLQEIAPDRYRDLAADRDLCARVQALSGAMDAELARPEMATAGAAGRPLAFFCAEFAIHQSLPIYAGGLGVLAGDFMKEVSDRAAPIVGVGLLYSQSTFHQSLDRSGWQQEYWLDADPDLLPIALVTDAAGHPITISVPIRGRAVTAQIWRVAVGRTPLFLLDTNRPDNRPADRWITARLYVGDRETRLAQYVLLGVGGVRALRALDIDPAAVHLNEGHAAFAALELLREGVQSGRPFEQALAETRARTVFTTHTPVAAGNDTFANEELALVLDGLPEECSLDWGRLLALGRVWPDDAGERFGMTPFALRTSRAANGVSRLHGEVARSMWAPMWPDRSVESVPIEHVTNGVHLPTWMAPAMQALLDRYLGPAWRARPADPAVWAGVDAIPDAELWAVRSTLRADLVQTVRDRSVRDRLARGESTGYAEAAAGLWDGETLTIGFARRIAMYKRLYLVTMDPERAIRLLSGERSMQVAIAGKAHPQDEEAKRTVQRLFALKDLPNLGARTVFLEDYEVSLAARLVQGCDVWVNLPRPPMEASGTSGMKSMLNGGLQLSVLDGWWAEAYDGSNGWAIDGLPGRDHGEQDAIASRALLDLLEYEALPLFYDRDADGIPRGWVQRVKASLRTLGPVFTTTRMLQDYMGRLAPAADGDGAGSGRV